MNSAKTVTKDEPVDLEKELNFNVNSLELPDSIPSLDDAPDKETIEEINKQFEPRDPIGNIFEGLDQPKLVKIGCKEFSCTQRPVGYLAMILNEVKVLIKSISDFSSIFNGTNNFKDEEGNQLPFSSDVILKFFDDTSSETFASAIRICQLLVEPIDQNNLKAPNLSNMALDAEYAKWSITPNKFCELLLMFYSRDVVQTGYNIKNVLSLSQ